MLLDSPIAQEKLVFPKIVVRPLPDYVARINKSGDTIYIDPSAPKKIHRPLVMHELAQWIMIFLFKFTPKQVEDNPAHEHMEEAVEALDGIEDAWYDKTIENCLKVIKARDPKPELPPDCIMD